MPALSVYINVENTALVVLQQKGFRVWTEQEGEVIRAEKDGWDFLAYSAVELLGLVAIYEFHQPTEYREYWWRLSEPWLRDSIPSQPPDFVPVFRRKKA